MNRKWVTITLVLVAVAALGLVGCQSIAAQRSSAAEAPTETAIVRRGTLQVTVDATGSVAPHAEVALAFATGGRVAEVLIAEGQEVEAGQPLARLDTDDLLLQLAQAEANVAQIRASPRAEDIAAAQATLRNAQANYDKVAAGARPEDIAAAQAALDSAQANYDKVAAGARPEDIAAAQAALDSAQANYDKIAAGPQPEDVTASEAALRSARGSLAASQGSLASAQANLARLLAGASEREIEIARLGVDQARDNLWAAQARRDAVKGNPHALAADKDSAEAAVLQAEVAVRIAELQYEEAKAGPEEEDIAAARAQVQQAQGQVEAAQAQVDQAQAQLEKLKNSPTLEELKAAQAQVDQAQAQLEKLKNSPTADELAAAQAQVDQARAQLEKLKNSPTADELAAAQAQVDQARAQLEKLKNSPTAEELAIAQIQVDQARLRLEQATLMAPMAGTITALNIQPGEMASVGQPAVVLSELADMQVEVNLDETDVARVTLGQEARVSLDAFPDVELTGEVMTIAPVAYIQSGVVLYPVTIRLSPTTLPVRAGMTADVEIIIVSQENALIVPLRAVRSAEGQSTVLRETTPGNPVAGFEPVAVTLGVMTETEVEITSGLAEGDVVSVVAAPDQGSARQGPSFGPFGGRD